jgi:hypothetical protein
MKDFFPFQFPPATAFYLVVYILSLVVHVVFMNYVLAGTGYLAFVSVFRNSKRPLHENRAFMMLRDWMPFALSAAITAGVAPLLFLQILYMPQFYTANLLLFHRWMAILPVLIIGFYLLYIFKGESILNRPKYHRVFVGCGAFACFAFVAYSWTENHLLSRQSQQVWVEYYKGHSWMYWNPELLPRLCVWAIGSVPTMTLILAWQLRWKERHENQSLSEEVRILSIFAISALVLVAFCAAVFLIKDQGLRNNLLNPKALPYLFLALAGWMTQLVAWAFQRMYSQFCRVSLSLASIGVFTAILGTTVLREILRTSTVQMEKLYTQHLAAMQVQGFWLFFLFLLLNLGLIAWCVQIIRRNINIPRKSI